MLLGFDIGGTKCAVVLGTLAPDKKMVMIDKVTVPTNKPVYEMIELLFKSAEDLLGKNQIAPARVEGIGISCGGPLSSKAGLILSPPNLPGWDRIPMVELAEKRFGKKVLMLNDANAGAIAEWKFGAGRGYSNLIFLTFGTGMGAGFILNGSLYAGASDLAGEVGHIRLSAMGPVGFGKAGSFEGWCSGGGIAQLAQIKVREKLQMGAKVSFCKTLNDLPKLTTKTVAEAAYGGDELASEIFAICGEYLGKGLALLIDVLNPEIIILGSIFGRAKPLLEANMWKTIEKEAYAASFRACKIVPAGLAENIGDMAALSVAAMGSNLLD